MYARKQPLLICVPYSVGEKEGRGKQRGRDKGEEKGESQFKDGGSWQRSEKLG
jgi:hypothetical protein